MESELHALELAAATLGHYMRHGTAQVLHTVNSWLDELPSECMLNDEFLFLVTAAGVSSLRFRASYGTKAC